MRDFAYVIVGGGAAAASAAEAIRKRERGAALAIFTREWAPPYQRPPLSKEFLQNRAPLTDVLMQPAQWYIENDVELHVGIEVAKVDPVRNTLQTSAGEVGYSRMLLATGAVPRSLEIPGIELEGVLTLRTYLDAQRLRGMRASAERVVLIGSGFIGMEVAASLRVGGCEVTVVTIDRSLYARFGTEVSDHAKSLFDLHGVQTIFQTGVAAIEGQARVESVLLADGRRIEAGAVVVGVGATPDVELAKAAGLCVDDGIVVDDRLRASLPNIYAAGDAARFPSIAGPLMRVEHFDNAASSGAAAGANMAGGDEAYRYVPFFWSDVFELSFEFVGDPAPNSKIVQGDVESRSFVVEYHDGGAFRGALLAGRSAEERDAYRNRLLSGAKR